VDGRGFSNKFQEEAIMKPGLSFWWCPLGAHDDELPDGKKLWGTKQSECANPEWGQSERQQLTRLDEGSQEKV